MSTELEFDKKKLPTLQDLTESNKELVYKNDALNYLLNQPTPTAWIKKHPILNVKVNGQSTPLEYVPVEKTKQLLTQIFQEWHDEIISVNPLFNAVCVHVRLKVRNPLTGEWIIHDGVGAVDVQTKSGASAADLSQITSSAVMKAAPAAASYALKNAAEKLGAIFGGNLQKYDLTPFMPLYDGELKQAINADLKQKYDAANAGNK